jgi:hypothetical protein
VNRAENNVLKIASVAVLREGELSGEAEVI